MREENITKLNNAICSLLNEYDHYTTANGVDEILNEWLENKGNLIATLSKHPNWDAENFRIVFNTDYERKIDKDGIRKFADWVYRTSNDSNFEPLDVFTMMLRKIESNIVDKSFEENFKSVFPDIACAKGTRIMKIVRRVLQKYDLDKIVDMQTTTWTDDNGIEHSRVKDMGSNYWIAFLGDSINPLKITRHTIISVNPLDYLTMSFGNGWASCHTIDKENYRHGRNSYEGQYCSGTLSYMMDSSSVIFYTVNADYEGNEYETQDKINRVMFHINEDYTAMVEGRVYPDARDGGDSSLAAQFRNVMQKVLSDCTKENNLWILKKGCDEIRSYISSLGTHYRDYNHYDDCNISLRKGTENPKIIYVGHNPICPECGTEHDMEDELNCEKCKSSCDCYCAYCDEGMCYDDAYYCRDNEKYYCSKSCARHDYVYYCIDDDELHTEDNCYYDNYEGEYYNEYAVCTEDGYYYGSRENAEADGYAETSDGEWYPEAEVHYDENRNEYFRETENSVYIDREWFVDEDSAEEAGYIFFRNDWYSEDDCVMDEYTGEMFPEDFKGSVEIETEDGLILYYISEETAKADGWVKLEDKWEKIKEVAA